MVIRLQRVYAVFLCLPVSHPTFAELLLRRFLFKKQNRLNRTLTFFRVENFSDCVHNFKNFCILKRINAERVIFQLLKIKS